MATPATPATGVTHDGAIVLHPRATATKRRGKFQTRPDTETAPNKTRSLETVTERCCSSCFELACGRSCGGAQSSWLVYAVAGGVCVSSPP